MEDINLYFGMRAGKVWDALTKGPRTLTQLQKATGLTTTQTSMGLGWLAREGKLRVNSAKSRQKKFELV
jgi:hypothetical protein